MDPAADQAQQALVARLAARGFINSIVIGCVLRHPPRPEAPKPEGPARPLGGVVKLTVDTGKDERRLNHAAQPEPVVAHAAAAATAAAGGAEPVVGPAAAGAAAGGAGPSEAVEPAPAPAAAAAAVAEPPMKHEISIPRFVRNPRLYNTEPETPRRHRLSGAPELGPQPAAASLASTAPSPTSDHRIAMPGRRGARASISLGHPSASMAATPRTATAATARKGTLLGHKGSVAPTEAAWGDMTRASSFSGPMSMASSSPTATRRSEAPDPAAGRTQQPAGSATPGWLEEAPKMPDEGGDDRLEERATDETMNADGVWESYEGEEEGVAEAEEAGAEWDQERLEQQEQLMQQQAHMYQPVQLSGVGAAPYWYSVDAAVAVAPVTASIEPLWVEAQVPSILAALFGYPPEYAQYGLAPAAYAPATQDGGWYEEYAHHGAVYMPSADGAANFAQQYDPYDGGGAAYEEAEEPPQAARAHAQEAAPPPDPAPAPQQQQPRGSVFPGGRDGAGQAREEGGAKPQPEGKAPRASAAKVRDSVALPPARGATAPGGGGDAGGLEVLAGAGRRETARPGPRGAEALDDGPAIWAPAFGTGACGSGRDLPRSRRGARARDVLQPLPFAPSMGPRGPPRSRGAVRQSGRSRELHEDQRRRPGGLGSAPPRFGRGGRSAATSWWHAQASGGGSWDDLSQSPRTKGGGNQAGELDIKAILRPLKGKAAGGAPVNRAVPDSMPTPRPGPGAPQGPGGYYGEWYGSPLYQAYMRSISQAGGGAKERLTQALEGPHAELRDVTESGAARGGAQQLLALLRPLWDELRVPAEVRLDGGGGGQQRGVPDVDLPTLLDHARILLAFRDATVLVINGLLEHERVLAQVRREVTPQAQGSPVLAQLQRIDAALLQFITTWGRRFAEPPWLDGGAPRDPPSAPAQFVWRGADALAQIRVDSASLWQLSAPPTPGSPVVSPARLLGGPRNCADRAALNDARGLRALLRSTSGRNGLSMPGSAGASTTDLGSVVLAPGRPSGLDGFATPPKTAR